MRSLNILFLGGGRRIALAKNFQSILKKRYKVKIYSYEIDKNNAFEKIGKVILGKKWNDSKIINDLHNKIKKFQIHLIVPCTDPATIVLAKLKEKKKSEKIISSSVEAVKICFDKIKMYNYLKKKDDKINLIPIEKKTFPIFVKPRAGSASINTVKLKNRKEMKNFLININEKNYIFQKFLKGKEYTVDTYVDKKNIVGGIIARERVRVLHGESIFMKTYQIKKINEEIFKILKAYNYELKGPITFQFIEYKKKFYLLEINPRVSGGINASIYSGLNIPLYLAWDYLNLKKKYKFKFKPVRMVKYFEETII